MRPNVLFVDDNKLTLTVIRDLFKDEEIVLYTAESGEEALCVIRQRDIAVLVSDNVMPGMSGVELLSSLKTISPDTVKILMSAYADLSSALAAINRSEVFRYVLKPWQDEEMLNAVREGIRRHRLLLDMHKEDEDILRSLAQTIELKDPSTKGHCDRVAVYALMIAEGLGLTRDMQREIKYGSWLHDCGKIGVSEVILNGPRGLSDEEFATIKQHSAWGADVAAKANLSLAARNIIRYHHERYDGSGYPEGLRGEVIPLEARIVAVADVFDALTTDRPYRNGFTPDETCAMLERMRGIELDPRIVDVFLAHVRSLDVLPFPAGSIIHPPAYT